MIWKPNAFIRKAQQVTTRPPIGSENPQTSDQPPLSVRTAFFILISVIVLFFFSLVTVGLLQRAPSATGGQLARPSSCSFLGKARLTRSRDCSGPHAKSACTSHTGSRRDYKDAVSLDKSYGTFATVCYFAEIKFQPRRVPRFLCFR